MQLGFHLTPFWSPTDRSPTQILDEAIEVIAAASTMGFDWVSIGQHFLSYPTVWPAPYPFLARIAPETGNLRLKTSVLLLPLLNPVEVAENLATLDHLSHGRLTVGVSIGYREQELATVGLTRKDRVPKLEESIQVLKLLWSGDEVTFQGRYISLDQARMGFRPYQQPHPPIEMGGQSDGAARRAAHLADSVMFGPQVGWTDVARLTKVYRAAGGTYASASRSLMVGRSREDAERTAREYLDKTFRMYNTWQMQESSMVPLRLSSEAPLDEWAIHGSPADCVEKILQADLEGIGFTIYSLPPSPQARIEYLRMIAEEIVRPVKAAAPAGAAARRD
jgi:alkanesulfonate monooxygenase SsuD/methylene tetrahydromethanopterin reductase-like flavin-dependent oxidoreductase (luciferase family)